MASLLTWRFLTLLPLCLAGDDGCGPGPYALTPPFDKKHSEDVCKTCVSTDEQCRWCPFSQSCAHPYKWFGGRGCMNSKEFKPVEGGNGCGAEPTEWMTILEKSYGKGLDAGGANGDVMRCLQNKVERWQMWPDPDLPKEWKEEKISDYSCMSALLREAVVASLGNAGKPNLMLLANASVVGDESPRPVRALAEGWESTVQETSFCSVYKQFLPKADCQAKTYGEHDFMELRKASQGGGFPADFTNDLRASMQRGPLRPSDLDTENYLTTWDFKYTLQLNFKEKQLLEKLLKGKEEAKPLKDHFKVYPLSLLQRIVSLVKIKIVDVDGYVLVKANEAHNLERKVSPAEVPTAGAVNRYDLKGTSRRQTSKSKNPYYGKNGEFTEEQQYDLPLRNWQCKKFLKYVQPDISFLESHGMTEYSLWVEIVKGSSVGCSDMPGVPLCNACLEDTTTLAIVDYVKDKTYTSTSPKKFGPQMMELSQLICPIDKKEGMESWQIFLIVGCFVFLLLVGGFLAWKYGAGFLRSNRPHELRDEATANTVEMTARNVAGPPSYAGYPSHPGYPGYPGPGYPGHA